MDILTICTPGHADPADSYGLIACQLARQLNAQGVHINLYALGQRVHGAQPPDVAALAARPYQVALGGLLLGYPTGYHRYPVWTHLGRRLALTMFESTRPPAGWVEVLNTLDAVITPSHFCRDVFERAGVVVPIHVVPLGVNETYRPAKRAPGRPLTFLTFLDRGKRKGGYHAWLAFSRAFGADPAYQLIVKTRAARLPATTPAPNVRFVQADLPEQALYQLYLEADVLIHPTFGEGFGLIPREFAATGGISLATNWGGTAEQLGAWGLPLPYRLVKADWAGSAGLAGQELGQWAEPDIEGVAEQLRRVAANLSFHRLIAAQQAPHVAELYSWRQCADQVLAVWRQHLISQSALQTKPFDEDSRWPPKRKESAYALT